MSILYKSDDGWIISHLNYLNNIYKTVEVEHENRKFEFNKSLFKVNAQYLRQNQIKNYNDSEDKTDSFKRKRKKRSMLLPVDILKWNNFVKQISTKILNEAKDLKLFVNANVDNNEESRLESKKCYLNTVQSNYNFYGNNQRDTACVVKLQNEKYIFPRNSKFYCYDIREMNEKFGESDKFDLILLDPPWWNKSIRRKKAKFEESSYKMMNNEEIAKIPIGNLLNSKGIVAIWCTNSPSHVKSILEEIFPAWGVILKAKWYWLKITQSGEPICNFNEAHGKQPYEQLILGTVPTNVNFNIPDNKVIISIPSAIHSHKPPLTDILKSYLPETPMCMEIFARYLLPEWTSWGMEVLKFQHFSLYTEVSNISR